MAVTNYDQAFPNGGSLLEVETSEQDRRLRHRLEVQSGQIEKVFARNQVTAEVTGGEIRPRAFHYDVKTYLQGGLERLRLIKNDLITALGRSVAECP